MNLLISSSYQMDLNIVIENCGPRNTDVMIQEKINKCSDLGFDVIALAVVTDNPNLPEPPKLEKYSIPNRLKVLTRVTVKVKETIDIFKANKSRQKTRYDLLAYEPQTNEIFKYILSSGNVNFEILTFDLEGKHELKIFKTEFTDLVKKGVCIEINYGAAQLNSALRRNIICQGQSIIERVRSRNIILSSGIDDPFRLRSPKDAKSIGIVFLLSTNKSHEAVFKNGQKCLDLAKSNSNPAASAICLKV